MASQLRMQRFALSMLALPLLAAPVMAQTAVSPRPARADPSPRAMGVYYIEGGQGRGTLIALLWRVHRAATLTSAHARTPPGPGRLQDCTPSLHLSTIYLLP